MKATKADKKTLARLAALLHAASEEYKEQNPFDEPGEAFNALGEFLYGTDLWINTQELTMNCTIHYWRKNV